MRHLLLTLIVGTSFAGGHVNAANPEKALGQKDPHLQGCDFGSEITRFETKLTEVVGSKAGKESCANLKSWTSDIERNAAAVKGYKSDGLKQNLKILLESCRGGLVLAKVQDLPKVKKSYSDYLLNVDPMRAKVQELQASKTLQGTEFQTAVQKIYDDFSNSTESLVTNARELQKRVSEVSRDLAGDKKRLEADFQIVDQRMKDLIAQNKGATPEMKAVQKLHWSMSTFLQGNVNQSMNLSDYGSRVGVLEREANDILGCAESTARQYRGVYGK